MKKIILIFVALLATTAMMPEPEASPIFSIGNGGTGYGSSFNPLIEHINFVNTNNTPCGPNCIRDINHF